MTSHSSFPSSYTSFPPPGRHRKMSIAQTYFLAHTARAKLAREAQRSDHNLRLLVGHANMLDCLMLELAEAEKEQERWFNQSVRRASSTAGDSRHIKWADRVVETSEDWDNEDALLSDTDTDSDSESDYGHDDRFFVDVQPIPSTPTTTVTPVASHTSDNEAEDEEQYEDDLEEDYAELALTRTNSHSHQPPELLSDEESEEEDTSPPSPPQPTFDHFSSTKEMDETLVQSQFYTPKPSTPPTTPRTDLTLPDSQPTLLDQGFFLPSQGQERIVEAF